VGRYRDDLSERQIRFDLLNGMTMRQAAAKYGCSYSLIKKIKDDRRNISTKQEQVPPEQLCECCRIRPKAEGLRFLCYVCFKGVDEDGMPVDNDDGTEHVNHHPLPECSWDDVFYGR
jgi:hypothetical protein